MSISALKFSIRAITLLGLLRKGFVSTISSFAQVFGWMSTASLFSRAYVMYGRLRVTFHTLFQYARKIMIIIIVRIIVIIYSNNDFNAIHLLCDSSPASLTKITNIVIKICIGTKIW